MEINSYQRVEQFDNMEDALSFLEHTVNDIPEGMKIEQASCSFFRTGQDGYWRSGIVASDAPVDPAFDGEYLN